MTRSLFLTRLAPACHMAIFAVGLLTVAWIGAGFVGQSPLAALMTLLIAATYLLGAHELRAYRKGTASLVGAMGRLSPPPENLTAWLELLQPNLRTPVRLRIEGERVGLPGPALTPYLVSLLVMLGMLGTFVGMVLTFQGAVFALEGSADLQAIRSALAAPIKGLSLSFGTSVAGVAASAALGLMSALARRERAAVVRQLDAHLGTTLRAFSPAQQRELSFRLLQQQAAAQERQASAQQQQAQALEQQAQALPGLVAQLQAVADGLDQRSQQLGERLLAQQARFHQEAGATYTELARSVGASLQEALQTGARAAGDSLRPVVEHAMAAMALEAQTAHRRQVDATQAQLQGLVTEVSSAMRAVGEQWRDAQNAQAQTEQTQRQQWTSALEGMADTLHRGWQRSSEQALAQHQSVHEALARSAADIASLGQAQARQTADQIAQLLSQWDAQQQARQQAEAAWVQRQDERMQALAQLLGRELTALRQAEDLRGQAAVARLDALQASMTEQLASLGAALEHPMTRLIQTASKVPQAAAEVIAQMRQDMARMAEREQAALDERAAVTQKLATLLQVVQQSTHEQRAAIEQLVESATHTLAQSGQQMGQTLATQAAQSAAQTAEVAARVQASAIELASLGESFGHGVNLFSSSSQQLMDSLSRIDTGLQQAMARSDEQLAYYVAQAREVIDLSLSAQQGLLEDLHRLRAHPVALAEGRAA